jgi:hypothetical protein
MLMLSHKAAALRLDGLCPVSKAENASFWEAVRARVAWGYLARAFGLTVNDERGSNGEY